MTRGLGNKTSFSAWMYIVYLTFFISIIFCFRAVSSISIATLLLSGIAWNKLHTGHFVSKRSFNLFTFACLLFYLLQLIGLLYTHNPDQGWSAMRMKSPLLFLPFALSCSGFINKKSRTKLMVGFSVILFVAALYCLYNAVVNFDKTGDASVFFYFQLCSAIRQHAVQYSILVFIALVHLFESLGKNEFVIKRPVDIFLIFFFSVFLFLLSSKLVIAVYFCYLLYFITGSLKKRTGNRLAPFIIVFLFIIAGGVALITDNPVSRRFSEIIKGDMALIRQDKYDPGVYFNGLQFRLLQWRFVSEILHVKKAWVAGVSPGDAQDLLDQKYLSENIYTGTKERGDRGFLGYNAHNQLLEALLQNGMPGCIIFLFTWLALLKMILERRKAELSFIIIMVLLYSLTESVFESQYSILLFIFFPLFFYLNGQKTKSEQIISQ